MGAQQQRAQGEAVLEAVENFIAQQGHGTAPDLESFCAKYDEDLRPAITRQCREYLQFDTMVGRQRDTDTGEGPRRVFGDFVIRGNKISFLGLR